MKSTWKLSLVAIMAGALALVLILGASMGTAAAPDPALSNDLLAMGDAGGGRGVVLIDVDAQAVTKSITGPDVNSNHGVVFDGQYVWTANAGQVTPGEIKVAQVDTASLSQSAAHSMYVSGAGGLCGIEFDPGTGELWTLSMGATGGNNGAFEVNETTGFTGGYVDTGSGADNRASCGIGWDASGTIAVASLMHAKKTTEINWPAGTLTGRAAGDASVPSDNHSTIVHILDTAKTNGLAYVSAGAGNGVGSAVDVVDLATMDVVGSIVLNGYNPHSVQVAHSEGFAYSHSREVGGGQPASILAYDIGGGSAGGTTTAPVLIGAFPDGGGAGSCGVDVAVKSDYCGQASLSLSKGMTYWKSMGDYTARNLTVDFSISNSSGNNVAAHDVAVHHTTETNGASAQSVSPIANIAAGGSSSFSIDYNVPMGTAAFQTRLHVTTTDLCGNAYSYGS